MLVTTMHGGEISGKVDFDLTQELTKVMRVDSGCFQRCKGDDGLRSVAIEMRLTNNSHACKWQGQRVAKLSLAKEGGAHKAYWAKN